MKRDDYRVLFQYLLEQGHFAHSVCHRICSEFECIELKPEEEFITRGKYVHQIGFLIDGILYSGIKRDENFEVSYFIYNPQFFSELASWFVHIHALSSIVAATSCRVLVIKKERLEQLRVEIPRIDQVMEWFSKQAVIDFSRQVQLRRIKIKKERFEQFKEEYGESLKSMKNIYLSNFLNIGYSYLSSLKSK